MYRLMAAIITFFCLYFSKPIFSNLRRTLNRKYRFSLSNFTLSLANFSTVFSISVAIAKRIYPISKIFLSNNMRDGISVPIDIKYLILLLNGSRGHISFILFYISVTELFVPAILFTNIFSKSLITIESKNDKTADIARSASYIVVFRSKYSGPRER
jgi:hypothetical protein